MTYLFIVSCSPDPTINSGTTNPNFHELFSQSQHVLHVCSSVIVALSQKQSD